MRLKIVLFLSDSAGTHPVASATSAGLGGEGGQASRSLCEVDPAQVFGIWVEGTAMMQARIKSVIFLPAYLRRYASIFCNIQWRANELYLHFKNFGSYEIL